MERIASRSARILRWLAFVALYGAAAALGAEKTPFFVQVRSNLTIDRQVAEEFGPRAGMFILRAAPTFPAAGYSYPELIARIKRAAPDVPVLGYAWISRYRDRGPIDAYLFRGLNISIPLAEVGSDEKGGRVSYIDVTNPAIRGAVVERLAAERTRLGVDGFAVDGASRTPSIRPRVLANICGKKPTFCDIYARSMDDIIETLNRALGEKGTLLYNGLWNLEPGMLADQSRLLLHADAASIEYFGMVPNEKRRGFTEHILAYLDAIPRLPKGKPLLFYGRGPWHYTDYAADYRWQRYLYASFLLGRRKEDLFMYLSSFQVPAHAGRTGGLDIFADWGIDLGDPRGPYRAQGGLYEREFSNGRVIVAPDDGAGGRIRLGAPYYTPEGKSLTGEVSLPPGEALILLAKPDKNQPRPAARRIGAKQIASWGWAYADAVKTPLGERVSLKSLPSEMEGEHDVLLDYERTLAPFGRLEIEAELRDPSSTVLAVAEVDDPGGTYAWAVVAVQGPGTARNTVQLREAVQFRARALARESWPELRLEYNPNNASAIVLDGPQLFGKSGLRFRRWSHVRFVGSIDVSSIILSRRLDIFE